MPRSSAKMKMMFGREEVAARAGARNARSPRIGNSNRWIVMQRFDGVSRFWAYEETHGHGILRFGKPTSTTTRDRGLFADRKLGFVSCPIRPQFGVDFI